MTKLLAYQYRMQVDELDEEDDPNNSDWIRAETEQVLVGQKNNHHDLCSISYVCLLCQWNDVSHGRGCSLRRQ